MNKIFSLFSRKSILAGSAVLLSLGSTVAQTGNTGTNFPRTGSLELFRTSLYFTDANGRTLADGVVNVYHNAYSADVDGDDSEQMANWDEDIAIVRGNYLLSIEKRPLIDNADTIFFKMERMRVQPYEWQFDPYYFNAPNLEAYLQDNFLATETPISLTTQTLINFTITTNAASSAPNRFRIVFRTATPLPVTLTGIKAADKQSTIQVEWNAVNELQMERYEVEKSTNGRDFAAAGSVSAKGSAVTTAYSWLDANRASGSNYYRIRSIGKNGQSTVSEVVRVNIGKGNEGINIYPNPAVGDVVTLQLNTAAGKYSVVISNKFGQIVFINIFEHMGGSASQTIQLPKLVTPGIYQLQLIGANVKYEKSILKQ